MPTRKKKVPAVNVDHTGTLELLKELYEVLKKFQQTVEEKSRNVPPDRAAGATYFPIFEGFMEHFKTIIDHQIDSRLDNARLVEECPRLCDFFRHQVASLYLLPLKIIFVAIKPTLPVVSSPILGLMSYIYHVKLEECRAAPALVPETWKDDGRNIGQCWESILAAFGDGIRLFMINAQQGKKLSQFQVMVGKVFYPFLAQVVGFQDSSNPHRLSDYAKRSLLDAGESLSGTCAENKDLIRDPTIFGPAILSHNIFNHSDFITANIALQIAYGVAPPHKIGKGGSKSARIPLDNKTARKDWFRQIFPVEKFGKSFQEQMVSRLASLPSQQFWTGLGDIQEKIFENDESRACAVPIQSGTVGEREIQFNTFAASPMKNTVQFNKHSLTWSSLVSKLGDDSVTVNEEKTAEICYEAIASAKLTGISKSRAPLPQCEELTLSIEFSSNSPIESCSPTVYYAPDDSDVRAKLNMRLQPQFADAISSILRQRKIKFSRFGSYFESHQTDDEDTKIVEIDSDPPLPVPGEKMTRQTSKISISKEPVCSWEAEHSSENPPHTNSRQRVESVQREAGINSSREEDSNSFSEQPTDLGRINDRSPSVSVVVELNSKSSPSVVHTGTPMSPKRKGHPRVSSPIEASCSRKEVTRSQKIKRTRIIESPDDSIRSSPMSHFRQGSGNELKKAPPSVTRQARETKAKSPLAKIPSLKSFKPAKSHDYTQEKSDTPQTIEYSTLSRKKMKASARFASEEIIDSCSDAEDEKNLTRSESIASIEEVSDQIMTSNQPEPIPHSDPEVEDEILSDDLDARFSKSSAQFLAMKMPQNLPGKRNADGDHRSITGMASRSRSVARKNESSKPQQAQKKVPKDLEKAGLLENRKTDPGSKLKRLSPSKSRLERSTFSPEIDVIEQARPSVRKTAFGLDVLKKFHRRKEDTDQEELDTQRTKRGIRISDLGKNLITRPKKCFQPDQSNLRMVQDSKPKKSAEHSINPILSAIKKTVQTPSSVDSTAQKTFNPFEASLRPIKSSEASGSKRVGRTIDVDQLSSTPLSRMRLEGSERSKEFMGKGENLRKPKRIRFESPRSAPIPRKINHSRSNNRDTSQRDTPSPVEGDRAGENEILHSVKRKRAQPDILLKDSKDLLKSALKTSTPSRAAARSNLENFQANPENQKIRGSSILGIDQEAPVGLYQSSSTSGKLVDWSKKATAASPSKYSDPVRNEKVNAWEEDASSYMNQLSEMAVAGIRNKQVKIKGVAATTQLGILTSASNIIKEFDEQSEAIKEGIAQHALQTQKEYKQYHNDVKQYRIKMQQDVNWANAYMNERTKDASPDAE
ncbi:hypothetical protein PtB15_13B503 [Puccinia triticina]|nr:hypothetical protein PtB15_13B503 [Puccinia triticina]